MTLGTVPTTGTRMDCLNCGHPDSAVESLFWYRNNVHEPDAMWNYHVCAECATSLKSGRRMLSQPAPIFHPPSENPRPIYDCEFWPLGFSSWLERMEWERFQDEIEWDRMSHDRG